MSQIWSSYFCGDVGAVVFVDALLHLHGEELHLYGEEPNVRLAKNSSRKMVYNGNEVTNVAVLNRQHSILDKHSVWYCAYSKRLHHG
jgi:hypothetical protein